MDSIGPAVCPTHSLSAAARRRLLSARGEPLLIAGWFGAVFIHWEVDAAAVQRAVPFRLDLREGRAFVSLVAFTMRGLRPRLGGRVGAWLFRPIAAHEFLNVRTYVRHHGEPGIYFLAEWLSNPVSVKLGPPTFGLPYRYGRIAYEHDPERGRLRGCVEGCDGTGRLVYEGELAGTVTSEPGSLAEFLLERYTAFTRRGSTARLFRIWHEPWAQTPMEIAVSDASLVTANWPWFNRARLMGAHYSPGLSTVWMGRPHRTDCPAQWQRRSVLSAFYQMP